MTFYCTNFKVIQSQMPAQSRHMYLTKDDAATSQMCYVRAHIRKVRPKLSEL